MCNAPFRELLALIDLDGDADLPQNLLVNLADRVYTVEGNSGDACKIKSYSLSYECIKGYGLMNW